MSETKHTPEQLALANEVARLAGQRNVVFFGAVVTAITKSALQARIDELGTQLANETREHSNLLKEIDAECRALRSRDLTLTAQVERLRGIDNNLLLLIGNVDHSEGHGPNAAKMRGGMLNDIREILQAALAETEPEVK